MWLGPDPYVVQHTNPGAIFQQLFFMFTKGFFGHFSRFLAQYQVILGYFEAWYPIIILFSPS